MVAVFLEQQGYRIIEQNYYSSRGEIDIIAMDGEYLCFIEVKYRKDLRNGSPEEAVTWRKQKRITDTARYYMLCHGISEYFPSRFDVAVILDKKITLFRNAFDAVC